MFTLHGNDFARLTDMKTTIRQHSFYDEREDEAGGRFVY